MNNIPKLLTAWSPLTLLSDNTHVTKPIIKNKTEYKLKPGEFLVNDRGEKVIIKPKNETVSVDTRNTYQKLQDLKNTLFWYKQYNDIQEEGIKNLLGFLTFITPSTWVGAATRNNRKSYFENVESGEGFGNNAANFIFDFATPFAIGRIKSLVTNAARNFPYRLWKPNTTKVNKSFLPDNTGTYYYSNGKWNIPEITKDIKKGTLDAIDFYKSDAYLLSLKHNAEIARRLGFDFEPTQSVADRVAVKPLKIDIQSISYPGSDLIGLVLHGTTSAEDIILYNIYHKLRPIAFHENIHRGFYGTAPKVNYGNLPYYEWAKKLKSTNSFYELKNLKILKPRSDIPIEDRVYWDYLDDPSESATNLLETGYRLNIPLGKPYPGDTEFLNTIKNTSIDKYYKLNTLKDRKNVWKALTGKYFVMPLAIGTGYSKLTGGSSEENTSY